MCGIVGVLRPGRDLAEAELQGRCQRMIVALRHRGSDDAGVLAIAEQGIALGHARLSILDLSPRGHQPMTSHSGRWSITFNGEIYNHAELRQQLAEIAGPFQSTSDTEVLLEAIAAWGVDATVRRAVGMFAFAAWDRHTQTLWLARDRLGEKPLYYGWAKSTSAAESSIFLFASELKALRAWPGFAAEVDPQGLGWLMRDCYIRGPGSIYRGISKLPPGCWLRCRAGDREPSPPVPYWSLTEVAANGLANPFHGTAEEATDQLQQLLRAAVKRQMVADVPVGAFLSGGIDSSAVVAQMQGLGHQPARTFTIRFAEAGYNEADHALAVARHLGTQHTEFEVTPQQALEVIPQLADLYDEPFADASQIPTYLVARLARQQVTVCLSGDGGDELFGGYARYDRLERQWNATGRCLPASMRQTMAAVLRAWPEGQTGRPAGRESAGGQSAGRIARRLRLWGEMLSQPTVHDLYFWQHALWRSPEEVILPPLEPYVCERERLGIAGLGPRTAGMLADGLAYLPDDILVKVDRAGMAVGLESRIPLLDPSIVEFAWSLPDSLRRRQGQSKWILRQVLQRSVPRALIERPKMGFGVPLDRWLRGPLRDWAESLLEERQLAEGGLLRPQPIRRVWEQHLAGTHDWQYLLWPVLMWQAWRRRWM